MSVMTPDDFRNGYGTDARGRNTAGGFTQMPVPPAQLQRQAVMDQLGTQPSAGPVAQNPGTFARGGQVKPLPTGPSVGSKVGDIGISTGVSMAGKQLGTSAAQAAAGGVAQSGIKSALTSGAGGAAAGMGIGIGTGLLAQKLRTKEEMPTFGGANSEYLDDLGRRFQGTGGGVNSNAIKYAGMVANPALTASTMGLNLAAGATYGAIKGAITKHAPSAYTDFKVEDAANAIKAEYKKELGRDASDEEVQSQLVGQGWDPKGGDRWVGEKGINSVMDQIRASPEAQAFKNGGGTRAAVMDQLGTGGPTASADLSGRAGQDAAASPDGAAAAPAGAVGDTSAWNTDGYQAPAYVPQAAGQAPPGWDATKWNDPNHQTPKYGVGRILSGFPPTVDGLKSAMADIEKAYPGTTFNGKDTINVPGVGPVDVLQSAGSGGVAWRWGPKDGGEAGAAPAQGGGASAADSVDLGARGGAPTDVQSKDTLAQIRAELDRIMRGEAPRDALMAQMGTANG